MDKEALATGNRICDNLFTLKCKLQEIESIRDKIISLKQNQVINIAVEFESKEIAEIMYTCIVINTASEIEKLEKEFEAL